MAAKTSSGLLMTSGLALALSGCIYAVAPPKGGGMAAFSGERRVDAADVALPPGYRIEPVATGLTFPTGIAFDASGRPHVVEAGYSYGEVFTTPRLLRLEPNGAPTVVANGEGVPWNGVAFHDGAFYVAQGGGAQGDPTGEGAILRITPDGRLSTLVSGLPGRGDHHTNGPAVGADGWVYFSQGTATNSAVVGADNAEMGWLKQDRAYHDIPCEDIMLSGANFASPDPFAAGVEPPYDDDPKTVTTGAFLPFGSVSMPGQVIRGRVPCGGAIMRVRPAGGPIELVAWGFRNPFGLAFAPDGALYATDNGYDDRGARKVYGTADLFWRVERGRWYGWPDYHNAEPLDIKDRYAPPGGERVKLVLMRPPGPPAKAAAVFGAHSSSNGLDFSRSAAFGHVGHAFVAQFGDQVPKTGKTLAPVGFKVVKVDPKTGVIADFAVNRGKINGPASWQGHGGIERPVDVQFSPDGGALYVVDFGVMTVSEAGIVPRPNTGVIWRITRAGGGR